MKDKYKSVLIILFTFLVYYIIWLIIGNKDMNASMTHIILMRNSKFYLFPWLVRNNLYWIAMCISLIGAILSKKYFTYITCMGATLGIIIGELLGPNPNSPTGHTHNGWWIWILIFSISIVVGVLFEKIKRSS